MDFREKFKKNQIFKLRQFRSSGPSIELKEMLLSYKIVDLDHGIVLTSVGSNELVKFRDGR